MSGLFGLVDVMVTRLIITRSSIFSLHSQVSECGLTHTTNTNKKPKKGKKELAGAFLVWNFEYGHNLDAKSGGENKLDDMNGGSYDWVRKGG